MRLHILKGVRRAKLLTPFTLPMLVLSSVTVPTQASASAAPGNVITLAAGHQHHIARPTLDHIKAIAARKGIQLEKAIASYIAREARASPAATANWPDGPVDIPDVMIDDLSASQINDLEGMAESEQIRLEEAIERYGYGRYTTRMGNQITAAFLRDLSGFVVEAEAAPGSASRVPSRARPSRWPGRFPAGSGYTETSATPRLNSPRRRSG